MELRDSASTFADLRITNKLASVAPQLAALPSATREAIAQREVTLSLGHTPRRIAVRRPVWWLYSSHLPRVRRTLRRYLSRRVYPRAIRK